ncbi:Uncharacterised protein [Chlamydia abortus]|nr:Uncharacterised protein [Chlamydia abortus]
MDTKRLDASMHLLVSFFVQAYVNRKTFMNKDLCIKCMREKLL